VSAIGEARTDGAADAAMEPGAKNAARAAERLQGLRDILVRTQAKCEGRAGRGCACGSRGDRPEQFEIGLAVRLRSEDGAVEAEGFHGKGLGDDGFLGQDMATIAAPAALA